MNSSHDGRGALLADIRPAHLWVPEGSLPDSGDEAAQLADQLGFDVEGPERDVLRTLLAEAPDGSWATLETAVVCGRQNIKTWALEMSVLLDLFVRNVKRVTWSAHLFKTTQDAFKDLDTLIGDTDWLRKRVRRVRNSRGEEGFDLVNGAQMDFLARAKGGGRGLSGNTVILDEALYLTAATQGALIPTLSARPNPHVRYGSSPGVLESSALRAIRNRGRAMNDPTLSYIEYASAVEPCADERCTHALGVDGCQLDDESKWAQANPALGRRISVEYVRAERRALSTNPVEFMRERMGWWEDPPDEGLGTAYPLAAWDACEDEASLIPDGSYLVFAVDVSWDRAVAHIATAGVRADGLAHVQVVAAMDPSQVVAWLRERVRRFQPLAIALQGTGAPVSSLVLDLENVGIPVRQINAGDIAKSCGSMYDAIKSSRVRHLGDPSLHQQVATAISRPLGYDGWALDRKKSPIDISGLVAITEALWVLDELVGSADYDVSASVA